MNPFKKNSGTPAMIPTLVLHGIPLGIYAGPLRVFNNSFSVLFMDIFQVFYIYSASISLHNFSGISAEIFHRSLPRFSQGILSRFLPVLFQNSSWVFSRVSLRDFSEIISRIHPWITKIKWEWERKRKFIRFFSREIDFSVVSRYVMWQYSVWLIIISFTRL